jgi:hypothetical protein
VKIEKCSRKRLCRRFRSITTVRAGRKLRITVQCCKFERLLASMQLSGPFCASLKPSEESYSHWLAIGAVHCSPGLTNSRRLPVEQHGAERL